MPNIESGPGLPEIETDYRAVKWRHVPALLAAIHDEIHDLRGDLRKAAQTVERGVVRGISDRERNASTRRRSGK